MLSCNTYVANYIVTTVITHTILSKDTPQDVALKCFTKDVKALLSDDLPQVYADVRSEFNKLIFVDHPHIVKCIGLYIISLSFVLELAPLGSLKNIINSISLTSLKKGTFDYVI